VTEPHPRGVFCASLTPLQSDLTPDHGLFVEYCRYLLNEGCIGIALLGTTGEANSFSSSKRKALLEATMRAGPPGEAPGKPGGPRNSTRRHLLGAATIPVAA
jgi:dihydrodipicolinate synthase/N-acetylneuraminate lyase